MTDAADIAVRYIAFWNETDPARRRALYAQSWTEDARFADPLNAAQGFAAIDALVTGVQAQFAGLTFRVRGEPDGHGEHVRFGWALGRDGEALAEGTDFAVLEAGRLKSVTGFFDKLPACS